jgi:hypothetical protein
VTGNTDKVAKILGGNSLFWGVKYEENAKILVGTAKGIERLCGETS